MLNFDPFNCTVSPALIRQGLYKRTINLRRIYNFNEGDFARFADPPRT